MSEFTLKNPVFNIQILFKHFENVAVVWRLKLQNLITGLLNFINRKRCIIFFDQSIGNAEEIVS